ncbi:FHA domain-containing protein [Streptomyces flaveolus]|uniref:ABC transporter ATP-binding protein/permease n=1 Tax=Streptomyces flaveolus TaxID=67297 RepID=UPI003430BA5D
MREQTGAVPELLLKTDAGTTPISPSRQYRIGRDPGCDVVLEDSRVSWHHAVLSAKAGHWTIEDQGSRNGTYAAGHRVRVWDVWPGSDIRFGSPTGPCVVVATRGDSENVASPPTGPLGVLLPTTTGTFRKPARVRPLPTRTVRIGRSDYNDIVIDDLIVSRWHAELQTHADEAYELVDLGSHNGTFLNGQPVERSRVTQGDIIGIGHSTFCLVNNQLQEYVDTGEVCLDVQDLSVVVGNDRRNLLHEVSFPVGEKSLLAIVGPSGAGKSTLLNALTGLRPADSGTVLYDGRDLYRNYAELRQRLGLVPQDDILHTQLTVRRALGYAAELRFPQDTAPTERKARVEEAIGELGLEEHANQPIHSLSGGQRKRVSVALELLTKPSLLFLDEPTSGLDPGMDRSVMRMLGALADGGRTVVVVTHSVLSLKVCDRLLVLARSGKVAYYGPPYEALPFLGFPDWPEAFEAFETDSDREWAEEYRRSPHHQRYVTDFSRQRPVLQAGVNVGGPPLRRQTWGAQLGTLVRRYAAVLGADRTFLGVLIALPVVMGVLTRLIAGSQLNRDTATSALLVLCVGAVLTGAANAVRELVKESVIYQRERAVGLSRSAYLMSKVLVLGTVTVAQAAVLALVALSGVDLNVPQGRGVLMPPLVEITLELAILAFTSMMLGLLISALVRKEEVTMPLLALLAIVQVVFCGALVKVHGMPVVEYLAWLAPSRWAFAAMAGTIKLASITPDKKVTTDPLFHTDAAWLLSAGMLFLLAVAFGVAVTCLLRRHEPAIMRK